MIVSEAVHIFWSAEVFGERLTSRFIEIDTVLAEQLKDKKRCKGQCEDEPDKAFYRPFNSKGN